MNILTKICVVLLVVASLVASVVFISLATVHPNYRTNFEQERQAYKQLELACRSYAEDARRSKASLAEARRTAGTDKIELQTQRDNALAEIRKLNMELLTRNHLQAEMNASLSTLSKANEAQVKLIEMQRKDVREAWARETKLQQEVVELRDQWKQQQALAERLAQNNRVLKEQAENLRQQNVEMAQKLKDFEAKGGGVEDAEAALTPENQIAGTITAVRNNIASVNIGSAHGLKKGMQLIVFRGGQFVGYLKIETVDVNEAAGVMTKKVLSPMQGDKVTSSLN
ncbi:MAG: hypothetical protein JXA11_02015 [Phycisphaerae bacterium]|nr:hypothetical protein [Phycisphaerae bacterium]